MAVIGRSRLLELLPSSPLTVAQVELLETVNAVDNAVPGLRDLGIDPLSLEASIQQLPRRATG